MYSIDNERLDLLFENMKSLHVGLFAVLAFYVFLGGCAVAPPRIIAPREDEWRYRQAAEAFISCGTKGDIDGMLRLTSALLIRENGERQVRAAFEKYEIPLLKGARVRLDINGVPLTERDTSYPEYEFAGTIVNGSKILPLSIFIGKEAGIYCLLGFKR